MKALSDLTSAELEARLSAWGFKPSHAERLLRAYYLHGGEIPWTDVVVPQGLREKLEAEFAPSSVTLAARQVAEDGTTKLLLRLADGRTIETVMMTDFRDDRVAGCVSSQVGCAMGCDFCATAQGGFARNLTPGEIVEQFLHLRREARAVGKRVQTLVFMGMGEPMLNLESVTEAIGRIAGPELGALGWKQVTVSTVGLIPGIEALAASGLGVHLAVSLHAPDDETRARLLPAGKRFKAGDILAAAERYEATTGRPVTVQYCLLKGVNDSPAQARQLAELLAGRRMHVNVLRYNPTGAGLSGVAYETSSDEAAEAFIAELRGQRVVAHFRRPRGRDIDAACGQLRRKISQETTERTESGTARQDSREGAKTRRIETS
jgi:23S rRNA (adenine2503-C2)-methyltransferase